MSGSLAWHNKSLERNPNVPAALTFEVDISGLERHFKLLETLSIDNIDEGFTRLEGEAQDAARRLIDKQIYDTPERGYERTGKLAQSIYAFKKRTSKNTWQLTVGAFGGAGGRLYALYNERGTYGARVSLESILKAAREVQADLIVLEYGNPASGLEPRPFVIPTVVRVHNEIPGMVLNAIREAEQHATSGQRELAVD